MRSAGVGKKERLFLYYSIKVSFRVTSIALSCSVARQPLHGLLSAFYARRKRKDFDFALTKDLIFSSFAARAFGIQMIYDAHHPRSVKKVMLKFGVQRT